VTKKGCFARIGIRSNEVSTEFSGLLNFRRLNAQKLRHPIAGPSKTIGFNPELSGDPMDFIEKLFGASPDGGNGTLELTLLVIPFLLLGLRAWWTQTSKERDAGKG
jgi:hypothetical protein